MTDDFKTVDHIAELLVHIGRACRAEDAQADLTVAQWICLRFFARANASTRTPSAFASFQATTRGTASQIIKALEARGLIGRRKSDLDARSVQFDLTEAGWALMSKDPLGDLNDLLGAIDVVEREALRSTLADLAASLARRKNIRAFGTCRDCAHFSLRDYRGFCACMAADLAADETMQLCGSYRGLTRASAGQENEGQPDDQR